MQPELPLNKPRTDAVMPHGQDIRSCVEAVVTRGQREGFDVTGVLVVHGPREMLRAIAAAPRPEIAVPRRASWVGKIAGVPAAQFHVRRHHRTGGRCQWYTVAGQRVQGTLERRYATALTALGVEWRAHHRRTWVWTDGDGHSHWYAPDFYLPDTKRYIEIKGFLTDACREKLRRVREQHRSLPLTVLFESDIAQLEAAAMRSGDKRCYR